MLLQPELVTALKGTLGENFGKLYDQDKQSDDIVAANFELTHMFVAAHEWTGSRASLTWTEQYAQGTFFNPLSEYCAQKNSLSDQVFAGLLVHTSSFLSSHHTNRLTV